MKIIIIYASFHHRNTEKVAKIISSTLGAKLVKFSEVKKEEIGRADLVGFGSGVYYSKFHKGLIDLVDNLPQMENKKAFLFSTSGMRKNFILNRSHRHFKNKLKEKGFKILGEYDCRGYDTYSLLKLIGGINRGRPNKKDLKGAKKFAKSIRNK